jgi:hypothetical protein
MHWINTTLDLLSPGWVGAIISFVGIIAAVVTYLLTRQRTRLAYCYAGKRLLGLSIDDGLPAGITVHYRGQDIPRLTQTLVVLWNAGEKTILGDDIVAADPLRLKLRGDGRVLAATVLKTKRDVCQIEALPDASCPNETHIHFAFLDAGDGAVIEVLHTSEERSVEILGTVRGLPQGLHDLGFMQPIDDANSIFIPLAVVMLGMFVFMSISTPTIFKEFIGQIILVGLIIFSIPGIALIYKSRRRHPKYLHIEELS